VSGGSTSPARVTAADELLRLVSASLSVGNPANRAADLPEQADPILDCQIELDVDDIRTYEHNPRRADNAKFDEIKESIRVSGIRNPITVTRRPGEGNFIVEAGGNTRLFAIQQLWRETGEARYKRIIVLFRPWRSESHVLIAHLIENEQRGEMTFWDKASGMARLKSMLESEQERAFSVREFEAELKTFGIPISTSTLSYYGFATARLGPLGDAAQALSGLDVRKLQVQLNLVRRHAEARGALDEGVLYSEVLEPVLRRHADEYRTAHAICASALVRDCEEALAQRLNQPVSELRAALEAHGEVQPAAAEMTVPDVEHARITPASRAAVDEVASATQNMSARNAGSRAASVSGDSTSADANAMPAQLGPPAGFTVLDARMQNFAQLAGIAASFQAGEALTCRLVPAALPARDALTGPELRAWQLLTLLCSLIKNGTAPQLSRDGGSEQDQIFFDVALLHWLLDNSDVVACAWWEVMAAAREPGVLSAVLARSSNGRADRQERT
jgi:ParB family protein of integrating conjugative element (PFGI_1 class)